MKTKYIIFIPLITLSWFINAQQQKLSGIIIANNELEGIHVINKNSNSFGTTNALGKFSIYGKINDTIIFSSIQYKTKTITITDRDITQQLLIVNLDDNINNLDEVLVGTILTGDLTSDILNTKVDKPIDFYDVGIPGYTGPRKTLEERLIHANTTGGGLTSFISLISGRTKKLKQNLKNVKTFTLKAKIESKYKSVIFNNSKDTDSIYQKSFFYYCAEDPDFLTRCSKTSEIEIIAYLQNKLKTFKTLQNEN